MPNDVKRCVTCGVYKCYDDFYKLKASKDGYYTRCKSCQRRPLSRGYALTVKNAVLLCPSCNCKKQAKMPEDCYSVDIVNQIACKLKEQHDAFQRHVS